MALSMIGLFGRRTEAMLATGDRGEVLDFINTIVAAVYVVDVCPDGTFRYFAFNRVEERDLGLTTDEVAGRTPQEVLSPEHAARIIEHYRRCVESRAALAYVDHIDDESGRRWSRNTLVPILGPGGAVTRLLGTAIERTDEKRAEEALAERVQFEHLVARVSSDLVNAGLDNVDEVIGAAIAELGRFTESDRLQVFQYDDDGERFSCTHEWVAAGVAPMRPRYQHLSTAAFPWYRTMIESKREVALGSVDEVPEDAAQERAEFGKTGSRSSLILPLVSAGRVIGALSINCLRSAKTWAEHTVTRFKLIAQTLAEALERAALERRLTRDRDYLRDQLSDRWDPSRIVGHDTGLEETLTSVRSVARGDTTVLITGETGTGKELIARAIHELSPRAASVLVTVNCAAISAGLVEGELFGHTKGAFTGAHQTRAGRFELADGGTLFLDEVGELDSGVQAKLLRVLQTGEFERVGSSKTIRADVRVIAATNRDLEADVKAGRFRPDLFYRLSVFPIRLPPLRERSSDIPELVDHFLARVGDGRSWSITPAALALLCRGDWPGNVRELKNVVERAVILAERPELTEADIAAVLGAAARPKSLAEAQAEHIGAMLTRTKGVIEGAGGAAELLGVSPSTLRSRMQKLGVSRPK